MGERRLEILVTVLLVAALAGVAVWRFDLWSSDPAEAARDDPFQILAIWQDQGQPRQNRVVLPRSQVAARAEAGALFETIAGLPGTPFAERDFLVFRHSDEALVTRSIQPRAVEAGNRCLMVIEARSVSALGGPLTAIVTLKSQLPEQPLCG
ncbi:MAG: hypothetical protein AAFR79_09470 [Pseudomonadota bacterium]